MRHAFRFLPLLALAAALPLARAQPAPAQPPAVREALAAFPAWDADRDGKLTLAELDRAIASPAVTGESAAAAVALRRLAQNKKNPIDAFTPDTLVNLAPALRFEDTRDEEEQPGVSRGPRSNLDRYHEAALKKITSAPRELFVGPPRPDRLRQGRLGSCFSLAPLGALALSDPDALTRLFRVSPDDARITVTFGRDETVTITPLTDGEIALGADTGGNGLWAATYEKAVGEYRRATSAPASAAASSTPYAVVTRGGSAGTMLGLLTGHAITRFSCRHWLPTSTTPPAELPAKLDELRALLRAATAEKRLMTAGTSLKTVKVPSLSQNHAYSVLAYDSATDLVTIRDPHGHTFTPKGPAGLEHGYEIRAGIFQVPVPEVVRLMAGFAFQTEKPRATRGYPMGSAPADPAS